MCVCVCVRACVLTIVCLCAVEHLYSGSTCPSRLVQSQTRTGDALYVALLTAAVSRIVLTDLQALPYPTTIVQAAAAATRVDSFGLHVLDGSLTGTVRCLHMFR